MDKEREKFREGEGRGECFCCAGGDLPRLTSPRRYSTTSRNVLAKSLAKGMYIAKIGYTPLKGTGNGSRKPLPGWWEIVQKPCGAPQGIGVGKCGTKSYKSPAREPKVAAAVVCEVDRESPEESPLGERTVRLRELAQDPAHRNLITRKGLHEAEVGLALEENGQLLGPIQRDSTGRAEFIDANSVRWDVKSFNSHHPPSKGGYELNDCLSKIERELVKDENVIIDTTDLTPDHIQELHSAIEAQGWSGRILWYP